MHIKLGARQITVTIIADKHKYLHVEIVKLRKVDTIKKKKEFQVLNSGIFTPLGKMYWDRGFKVLLQGSSSKSWTCGNPN